MSVAFSDSDRDSQTLLDGVLYPGNGSHLGEAKSPLKKEFRLQSDFELARYSISFLRDLISDLSTR